MSGWQEKFEFLTTIEALVQEMKSVSLKALEKQIEAKNKSENLMLKLTEESEKERNNLLDQLECCRRLLKKSSEQNAALKWEMDEQAKCCENLKKSYGDIVMMKMYLENELANSQKENIDLKNEIETLRKQCADTLERAKAAEESEEELMEINAEMDEECLKLKEMNQQLASGEVLAQLKGLRPIIFECPNFTAEDFLQLQKAAIRERSSGSADSNFMPSQPIAVAFSKWTSSDTAKVQLANSQELLDALNAPASTKPALELLNDLQHTLFPGIPLMYMLPRTEDDVSRDPFFGQMPFTNLAYPAATNQQQQSQASEPTEPIYSYCYVDESDLRNYYSSYAYEAEENLNNPAYSGFNEGESVRSGARNESPEPDSDEYSIPNSDQDSDGTEYSFAEQADNGGVVDCADEEKKIAAELPQNVVPSELAAEELVEQTAEDAIDAATFAKDSKWSCIMRKFAKNGRNVKCSYFLDED